MAVQAAHQRIFREHWGADAPTALHVVALDIERGGVYPLCACQQRDVRDAVGSHPGDADNTAPVTIRPTLEVTPQAVAGVPVSCAAVCLGQPTLRHHCRLFNMLSERVMN